MNLTGGGDQVETGTQHTVDPDLQLNEEKLALDVVPEESDEELPVASTRDDENERNDLKTPGGSIRVPSQKSRPLLVRTPATKKREESPLIFPEDVKDDDEQILITEINQGEYREVEYQVEEEDEAEFSDSEDVPHVTIETVDAEPTEEDYDTDLEIEEKVFHHDTSGKSHYRKFCNQLGVVPINYFLRHIEDTEIAMRYHGLGPSAAKAIALVLKDNITLEKFDIRGNWIEGEGGESMARMLEENEYITDLCLADNKLGLEGVTSICRMLKTNTGLRRIDLSDNGFDVPEALEIAQALENNKYLKVLNLSHNRFGEKAGEILGPAIGANDILDVLDLSWNHLRQNGAIAVAKGIKENVRLKKCNLAWNGFGPQGGAAIADALVTNNSLQDIDISGNRLNSDVAIRVAKAITTNDNIRVLRLGNNLLTTQGAIALVKAINETESSEMEELDLTDVPVEFEFLRICEDIKAKRPDMKITHGPILRAGNTADDIGKPGVDLNPRKKDPVMLLKEHIVVNDYRLLDILKRYDPEGTMTLEPEHFLAAIDELAVPFDRAKIEEAVKRLVDQKPGEEQGRIYFGNFFDQEKLQEHIKRLQEKPEEEN